MKTNLLKLVALLSLSAPLAANAMSIIYDVDRTIGFGSVMGTITTDGMQGDLQAANIEAFDLVLDDGVEIFTISLGGAVIDSGLSADAAGLNINWDVADVIFFFEIDASENWQWRLGLNIERVIHVKGSGPGSLHYQDSGALFGTEQIAIARVTSLPESSTLWMLLMGFSVITLIRRSWRT